MKQRMIALLAALALALGLLAGCGGRQDDMPQSPAPAPAADGADVQKDPPASGPAPAPEAEKPADAAPSENEETDQEKNEPQAAGDKPAETQQDEPAPAEPSADPEPAPAHEPAPEPAADPAPAPDPAPAQTVPEDGTYTVNVTLSGGSGRASVESPAALRCEGGKFYATIIWSSPNFDYMKVDGEKYLQTNTEGNSAFEIPVAAFDQELNVIADTVAMSEPHEVEYTLTFDSASLQKQ